MKRILVVAYDPINLTIGSQGQLPWHQRNDLYRFRQLTLNKVVLCGHKTFLETGVLDNRTQIVITRNPYETKNTSVSMFNDFSLAEKYARQKFITNDIEPNLYIIGGQTIYDAYISEADEIWATWVFSKVDGDKKFYDLEKLMKYGYRIQSISDYMNKDNDNEYDYQYVKFTKGKYLL